MSTKIFIISDQELSHAKFKLWLRKDSENEIVGEAKSTKDFLKQIKNLTSDVIIIDSESIDLDKSLVILDKIEKYNFKTIIVFSHHSNHIFILIKIKSEAKAYTCESECRNIFLKALKNI